MARRYWLLGVQVLRKAFIRRLLQKSKPSRVVVLSRDELKQTEWQKNSKLNRPVVRFFIGDVRDEGRLNMAGKN